jgi:hypothetical protein
MRHFLVISLCLLGLLHSASAQVKQGMLSLGASANVGTEYSDPISSVSTTNNSWSTSLSPSVGYYYSNHSALGLSLNYAFSKNEEKFDDSVTGQSHTYSFTASPFWRHNGAVTDKFGVYGIASPMLNYSVSDGDGESQRRAWNFGASMQVGAYYFPVPRISVEASLTPLSFVYDNTYTSDTTSENTHQISLSLRGSGYSVSTFSLSFFYYFLP